MQVSTKLNRSHLITGDEALILPCLGRTERDSQASGTQFVCVEDSMGMVHSSQGRLDPASTELMSEPAIVVALAQATLGETPGVDWSEFVANYDSIRDRIAAVIPGFENLNSRIRTSNGFELPNAVRDLREFRTASKKALFTIHPIPHLNVEAGQFVMTTIRSHDQYNTTIYGLEDRYRGIHNGRRVVLMNADDMAAQNYLQATLWILSATILANNAVRKTFVWWRTRFLADASRRIFQKPMFSCRSTVLPRQVTLQLRNRLLFLLRKSRVTAEICGLILTGGKSLRMGKDKAQITYSTSPQWQEAADLLRPFCAKVYWSCTPEQKRIGNLVSVGWSI